MAAIDTLLSQYPAGSKVDVDGFPKDQPYQCFDPAVVYVRLVSGNSNAYVHCATSGYVKDWWNDFAKNGLNQWFDQIPWNSKGQLGDIAIWGNAPATPYSHIAMVLEDNGTTQKIYGQNQPNPYTTIISFTSKGLLGYLRPKGGKNVAIIENADNWKGRANRSFQTIRGRDMGPGEFEPWIGQDFLHLIEALEDDTEATDHENYANIGKQAQSGNWQGQIGSLTTQLTKAQSDLKVAQDADIVDKTTISSLQATINDLNKKIDAQNTLPTTGGAGTAPTPPIDYSWVQKLQDWLKGIFTKGDK